MRSKNEAGVGHHEASTESNRSAKSSVPKSGFNSSAASSHAARASLSSGRGSSEAGEPLGREWAAAAAIGALWGALEITLGSFVHSLRIPFGGLLLSASGAALMVAGHDLFPSRGFFLRTALVCALCKSFSPGGIIWTPMIAILMEGALMELAFLLPLGWRISGALGGGLGMLWSILQTLLSHLVFYGMSVLELYWRLLKRAERWLGLSAEAGWYAITALLGLAFLIGVAGGLTGFWLARRARRLSLPELEPALSPAMTSPLLTAPSASTPSASASTPSASSSTPSASASTPSASSSTPSAEKAPPAGNNRSPANRRQHPIDKEQESAAPQKGIPPAPPEQTPAPTNSPASEEASPAQISSARWGWLMLGVAALALLLQFRGSLPGSLAGLFLLLALVLWRDRGVLRRLGSWRFWLLSLAITALSGLFLGKRIAFTWQGIPVSLDGLALGAGMVVRAALFLLLILLLARRLPRERFVAFTRRLGLPQLAPALQIALELIPQLQQTWKQLHQPNRSRSTLERVAALLLVTKQIVGFLPQHLPQHSPSPQERR